MKTKLLFISILLFGATSGMHAQSRLFEKLSNEKNITVVTITKTLLKLMPQKATDKMDMSGLEINHLMEKLDQIDIFVTEDNSAMKTMREDVKVAFSSDKTFENIMKIKEKDSDVNFYVQRGNGEMIKSLVMFVNEKDEGILIRLLGNFTAEDIQTVVSCMDM